MIITEHSFNLNNNIIDTVYSCRRSFIDLLNFVVLLVTYLGDPHSTSPRIWTRDLLIFLQNKRIAYA